MHSEAVYFEKEDFCEGKLRVSWHYSQAIFCFFCDIYYSFFL
jgi:hypothetical protein